MSGRPSPSDSRSPWEPSSPPRGVPQLGPDGEPFYGDLEPHRGVAILTLGIASIVCGAFGSLCCMILAGVGLVPGIVAWVLGNGDSVKVAEGIMDPSGKGLTDAGWMCGIIGTVISAAGTLLGIAGIVFYLVLAIFNGNL